MSEKMKNVNKSNLETFANCIKTDVNRLDTKIDELDTYIKSLDYENINYNGDSVITSIQQVDGRIVATLSDKIDLNTLYVREELSAIQADLTHLSSANIKADVFELTEGGGSICNKNKTVFCLSEDSSYITNLYCGEFKESTAGPHYLSNLLALIDGVKNGDLFYTDTILTSSIGCSARTSTAGSDGRDPFVLGVSFNLYLTLPQVSFPTYNLVNPQQTTTQNAELEGMTACSLVHNDTYSGICIPCTYKFITAGGSIFEFESQFSAASNTMSFYPAEYYAIYYEDLIEGQDKYIGTLKSYSSLSGYYRDTLFDVYANLHWYSTGAGYTITFTLKNCVSKLPECSAEFKWKLKNI